MSPLLPPHSNSLAVISFIAAYYHNGKRRNGGCKRNESATIDREWKTKQNHRWLLTTYDKRDFNRLQYEKGWNCAVLFAVFFSILFNAVLQPQNFLLTLVLFLVFFLLSWNLWLWILRRSHTFCQGRIKGCKTCTYIESTSKQNTSRLHRLVFGNIFTIFNLTLRQKS